MIGFRLLNLSVSKSSPPHALYDPKAGSYRSRSIRPCRDYETKIESPAPGSTQINMWERPSQLAEVVPNKFFIRVPYPPALLCMQNHHIFSSCCISIRDQWMRIAISIRPRIGWWAHKSRDSDSLSTRYHCPCNQFTPIHPGRGAYGQPYIPNPSLCPDRM